MGSSSDLKPKQMEIKHIKYGIIQMDIILPKTFIQDMLEVYQMQQQLMILQQLQQMYMNIIP